MAYKWYDSEQEIYCVSPSAADDSSAKLAARPFMIIVLPLVS